MVRSGHRRALLPSCLHIHLQAFWGNLKRKCFFESVGVEELGWGGRSSWVCGVRGRYRDELVLRTMKGRFNSHRPPRLLPRPGNAYPLLNKSSDTVPPLPTRCQSRRQRDRPTSPGAIIPSLAAFGACCGLPPPQRALSRCQAAINYCCFNRCVASCLTWRSRWMSSNTAIVGKGSRRAFVLSETPTRTLAQRALWEQLIYLEHHSEPSVPFRLKQHHRRRRKSRTKGRRRGGVG